MVVHYWPAAHEWVLRLRLCLELISTPSTSAVPSRHLSPRPCHPRTAAEFGWAQWAVKSQSARLAVAVVPTAILPGICPDSFSSECCAGQR